jgi:hypothetical protein
MEAIMQRLVKGCVKGVLGLGAVALLLAGVPAHATPGAGTSGFAPAGEFTRPENGFKEQLQRPGLGRRLATADASRGSQSLLLAEIGVQSEEAEKLEHRRLQEQEERVNKQKQDQQQKSPSMKRMRGPTPAPKPMPEAERAKPSTSRFGAGVIRNKDSEDGE